MKKLEDGLFGMIIDGRIENVTINGNITSDKNCVAGIVGNIKNGTIYKCTNNASISGDSSISHAGIAGNCYNSTIQSCTNSGNIGGKTLIGGIVGNATNNSTIEDCTNTREITGSGTIMQGFYTETSIAMCHVGGIVGALEGNSTINSCSNEGTITTSQTSLDGKHICLGGISGLLTSNSTVNKSNNKREIIYKNANGLIGGIVGYSVESTVNQCYNTEGIQGRKDGDIGGTAGGIIGWNDGGYIKNCYNTAQIEGGYYAGGIMGGADGRHSKKRSYIYNCYSANTTILGNLNVGTFIAELDNAEIKNCCFITDTNYIAVEHDDIIWTSWKFLTIDEMKKSSSKLLDMLNSNEGTENGEGLWAQDTKNDGLPYLKKNLP